MPRNSSGTYSRISPPGSGGYTAGTTIDPAIVNGEVNDLGTELTNSIDKGGRTTATANLPMGGFKHTGVADGSARNDYASLGQVQDGAALVGAVSSSLGSGTCTLTPAITAYTNGQRFRLKWSVDGVGANILDINGLGTKSVKKYVNASLSSLNSTDIRNGSWVDVVYDSANDCFIADFLNHEFSSVKAAAFVYSNGVLARGYNVASVSRTGFGRYNVTITNITGMNTTDHFAIGTADDATLSISPHSAGVVTVKTNNSGGSGVDADFSILFF